MINKSKQRTTIGVTRSTKELLNKGRAPGQCYDGFLYQMVSLWNKQRREFDTENGDKGGAKYST